MNPQLLNTRPTEKRLLTAYVFWFAILLLRSIVIIAGVAVWFPALQKICLQDCSQWWQLTPDNAQALQSLGWSLAGYAWYVLLIRVLPAIISFGIGAFILWQKPNDRMVLVVSLYLIVGVDASIGFALSHAQPYWWVLTQMLSLISTICYTLFFYVFPSGYFVPRWTRWAMIALGVAFFINTFFHGSPFDYTQWDGVLGLVFGLAALGSLVLAQIYRYFRVSTPVERAQTRWVVGVAVFAVILLLGFNFASNTISLGWFLREAGTAVVGSLTPVALAIAVLRYHLWDIDVIIRRTLQYSVLTGLLGLVYFGMIVFLQTFFFSNQTSEIAIVLSTLAIAALFNPLRRRVQDFIDRRFYRRKYNAEQALAQFAETARDEVDMDKLAAALIGVVEETVQPERVSVWLKDSGKVKRDS